MDDDDHLPRKTPREKASEIAQIASAFLEPEDLQRMGVDEKDGANDRRLEGAFGGVSGIGGQPMRLAADQENRDRDPSSPTPGSPRPEDLPTQPHYPQSTSEPQLVTNGIANDPNYPYGDENSNESSSKR